jgi:predicted amidohydrolase
MDRIRVATLQTEVTTDPAVNGRAIRHALREAADGGARLAHLSESALTGYAGQAKPHFDGWHIDWAPVRDEVNAVAELAGELSI